MTVYKKIEIDIERARIHARAYPSVFSRQEREALLAIYDAVEAGRFTEAFQIANNNGRTIKKGIICDFWDLINDHAHGEIFILPGN